MERITKEFFNNLVELNDFAARKFVEIGKQSIEKSGRFNVALSGGSTPKKLYAVLTGESFRSQIDWQKIQFFFGDERFVSADSAESNFRMANEELFLKLEIPGENIHRFKTENGDPASVAEEMENEIRQNFSLGENEFPRFDLIFLGMGADGHTASLFPETPALNEKVRIAAENFVAKLDAFRLTLTFPAINNARNIIFLISGEEKKKTFAEVFDSDTNEGQFPAQKICPTNGELLVLADIQDLRRNNRDLVV